MPDLRDRRVRAQPRDLIVQLPNFGEPVRQCGAATRIAEQSLETTPARRARIAPTAAPAKWKRKGQVARPPRKSTVAVARGRIVETAFTEVSPAMLETIEGPARQTSLQLPDILTDAELRWLGVHNESLAFEQTADGLLIMTPATGSRGNRGEIRLTTELTIWNDRVKFGEIRGMTGGLLLPKGGKYQADGFVISAEEWAGVPIGDIDASYPSALPTAAFELLSPANLTATGYTKEFAKKLEDYERSAIPVVVLLHPNKDHATIRRPGSDDETTAAKLVTFPELPGLELDAGAIYADCNRR
jgi:Uma2 family endonuclease